MAELAAARTEKQSQKKKKKRDRRGGGGDDDDFEKEEEEEEEPALAFLGDDEDEEEEDFVDLDDDDNNGDGPSRPFQRPDARSDAHRTALAKLPAVIEWLSTVFGCGGAGSSSAAASNYSQGVISSSSTTTSTTTTTTQQQQELPKTVIFAHHHNVMDALASALTSFGIRFVRIDGSVDGEDRRAAVAAFRSGARGVRAALLSVTAAGTGLDFASASSVVFAELPDEPALVRQAEDRAHRRGRGEGGAGGGEKGVKGMPLNVYFLIAKGTSDERRWRALDAGLQLVAEALADEQGTKGGGGGSGLTRPNSQAVSQTPTRLGGCVGFGRRSSFFGSSSGMGGDARGLAVDRIREVPSQAATQAAAAAAAAAKAAAAAASLLAAVRAPPETLDGSGSRGGETGSSTPASSSGPSERFSPPSSPPSEKAPSPAPGPRLRPAAEAEAAATPRTVSPADDAVPAAAESENEKEPLASSPSPFPPFPRLVWFELSPHTGRLHLHGAPDGSAPLGLSVPLEDMAACCSSSSSSERGSGGTGGGLAGAVALLSAALVAPGGPCCPATDRPLPPRETLRDWERDAAELAGELFELRGVLRARFAAGGRLLRPPLTMVAAAGEGGEATTTTTTEAEDDGSGRGTVRHDAPRAPLPEVLERLLLEQKRRRIEVADGDKNDDGDDKNDENKKGAPNENSDLLQKQQEGPSRLPPPPSFSLLEVPVAGIGGRLRPYLQPFDATGKRLCLACGAPTPCQLPASAPLLLAGGSSSGRGGGVAAAAANGGGRSLLFCGGRCDALHAARTSASAARAALFRVERGVCCACGLDCHALVRDLRAIQKKKNGRVQGSDVADNKKRLLPLLSWRRRRLALILERAPSFRGAKAAAAAARLAGSAVGGHAWQADHVVAVHRGGGACGVGNLRTLCVPCHAEVTAAQARERARRRRREKRRKENGGGGVGDDAEDENDDDDGDGDDDDFLPAGAPAGLQRALMLHARMGAGPRFIDDDDEDEEEEEEESDDEEEESDDEGDGGGRHRPPPAARRRARKAAVAQQLMPPPPPRRPPPPPVAASVAAAAAPPAAPASRPLAELAAMSGRGSMQQQGRKRSK